MDQMVGENFRTVFTFHIGNNNAYGVDSSLTRVRTGKYSRYHRRPVRALTVSSDKAAVRLRGWQALRIYSSRIALRLPSHHHRTLQWSRGDI